MAEPTAGGSFVMLWAGENPSVHMNLLEALESAGIPFSDKSLGDDEVSPTADPLPIDWKPRFGFEVSVDSVDFPAANQILEKILQTEPENLELPARDLVSEPPPPAASEASTVEIWEGLNPQLAKFLESALGENDIPVRTEQRGVSFIMLVPESTAARAREIVREVVEAAPPN